MMEPRAEWPAHDAEEFVNEPRSMNVTRMFHRIPAAVALSLGRSLAVSQRICKRVGRHSAGSIRLPGKRQVSWW